MQQSCYRDIQYQVQATEKGFDIRLEDATFNYKARLSPTGELALNVYRKAGGPETQIRCKNLNGLVKILNVIQRARKEQYA